LMDRREGHIFGRRTLPQMDLASVSCAIQNIWLAARAEGLGVGWVSLFDPDEVKSLLDMPDDSLPIAILCIGHVEEFYDEPMLEQLGWRQRGKLDDMVMENGWDAEKAERSHQRDK
jgi:5,6-dimethylbenzimidazole synthase